MKALVKTLMIALISLLSVYPLCAQVEDFDPGVIFIMQKDTIPIGFDEGQEWDITFSCEDTLGNIYNHPVSMIIEGGPYQDSLNFALQNVDSLLMYQPEPVLAEGVYEITREHFPYIIGTDSTYTVIYFSPDITGDIALPEVGIKVVCNLEERPLPIGFLGVVSDIRYEDGRIALECRGSWSKYSEFYDKAIIMRHAIPLDELDLALPEKQIRRRGPSRRFSPSRITQESVYDEVDWLVELNISPGKFEFSKGIGDNVEISGSINVGELRFGGDIAAVVFVDGEWKKSDDIFEFVKSEKRDIMKRIGIQYNMGFDASAEIAIVMPIAGLGIPKKKLTVLGNEFELLAGLYFEANAKVTLNVPVLSGEWVGGVRILAAEVLKNSSSPALVLDNFSITIEGDVSLNAQVKLESTNGLRNHANERFDSAKKANAEDGLFDFQVAAKAVVNLIIFSGKCEFVPFEEYSIDTPTDLYSNWETQKESLTGNLKILDISYECTVTGEIELSDLWTWSLGEYKRNDQLFCLLSLDTKYMPDDYVFEPYQYSIVKDDPYVDYNINFYNFGPGNILYWCVEGWVYDLSAEQFVIKEPLCSGLPIFSSLHGKSNNFKLRKGKMYQLLPAFAHSSSSDAEWMTNMKLESFRVPYSLLTHYPQGNTLYGEMEQLVISDYDDYNIEIKDLGFQCIDAANEDKIADAPLHSIYDSWFHTRDFYADAPVIAGSERGCYRSYMTISDEVGTTTQYGPVYNYVVSEEVDNPTLKILSIDPSTTTAKIHLKTTGLRYGAFRMHVWYTDNMSLSINDLSKWKSEKYYCDASEEWTRYPVVTLSDLSPNSDYQVYAIMDRAYAEGDKKTFRTLREESDDEWVDLGLSVLWHAWNLGASNSSQVGTYYSWGETDPYDQVYMGSPGADLTTSSNDAAMAAGVGRMPTADEVQELIDNCEWSWDATNKCIVAEKDGKYIYFPVTGYYNSEGALKDNSKGVYAWTRSYAGNSEEERAYCFEAWRSGSSAGNNINVRSVDTGLPIRPVKSK